MSMGSGHQVGEQFLIVRECQGIMWANDDDQIVSTREIMPEQPDGFSQESFHSVSTHGIADAARHAQTPAAIGKVVWPAVKRKRTAGLLDGGGIYSSEGDVAAEAVGSRKCVRLFGQGCYP